jgi:CBS domain-containing protein
MAADDDLSDDPYFDRPKRSRRRGFDAELLRAPVTELPVREALVLSAQATVTEAMRAMQREHRGYVLVTDDGTRNSKLLGIFTERDVLFRIVDRGKNPATLPLGDVMTPDPDVVPESSSVAFVLNKMSIGGFRHVPVVDQAHRPRFVVAVRDVVAYLVEAFPREVLNLPLEADLKPPKAREGA